MTILEHKSFEVYSRLERPLLGLVKINSQLESQDRSLMHKSYKTFRQLSSFTQNVSIVLILSVLNSIVFFVIRQLLTGKGKDQITNF